MILPTRDLSVYNLNPNREDYEDMEEYRQRRALNRIILKEYKKGTMFWNSKVRGTYTLKEKEGQRDVGASQG
jgi:hypothetical protein|tara:strand:+ start:1158 stop:1373 length:216 start_codon:yes stop_codon:yes gene_type:complete